MVVMTGELAVPFGSLFCFWLFIGLNDYGGFWILPDLVGSRSFC